jgi:hypothetical protein
MISGGSTEKALPHKLDRVRRSATVVAAGEPALPQHRRHGRIV